VPSTRFGPAFALVLALVLAGCVGGAGFLGLEHPTATVENRASVGYDVTITTVHTDDPLPELPVALRYRNGTLERTTLGAEGIEDDPDPVFFVPENVTAFRADGPPVDRWNVSLGPSERVTTTLGDWRPGDVVFVEWERPDGTVVRVKRVGCRRGLQSFERYVEDRRGGGGGGTSCTEGGPI
jgi:hypothetical protein